MSQHLTFEWACFMRSYIYQCLTAIEHGLCRCLISGNDSIAKIKKGLKSNLTNSIEIPETVSEDVDWLLFDGIVSMHSSLKRLIGSPRPTSPQGSGNLQSHGSMQPRSSSFDPGLITSQTQPLGSVWEAWHNPKIGWAATRLVASAAVRLSYLGSQTRSSKPVLVLLALSHQQKTQR